MRFGLSLLGLFVGVGLGAAGFFISETMLKQRTGVNTATVKGLSERIVASDYAHMQLYFEVDIKPGESVAQAFERAKTQRALLDKALRDSGIDETEIHHKPLKIETQTERDKDGVIISTKDYVLTRATVATRSPTKLDAALAPLLGLATQDIRVQTMGPYYEFTGLNTIKPDMLREATENARIAANEFAANANVRVGGIQLARQGGFQVNSLPARPGITEAGQHEVRVVTTITFYLEN